MKWWRIFGHRRFRWYFDYVVNPTNDSLEDKFEILESILRTSNLSSDANEYLLHSLYHFRYQEVECRFEGFTGTSGAVKPRSSVDVSENRSSKSMDDDLVFLCRLFLGEMNVFVGQGMTSQSELISYRVLKELLGLCDLTVVLSPLFTRTIQQICTICSSRDMTSSYVKVLRAPEVP